MPNPSPHLLPSRRIFLGRIVESWLEDSILLRCNLEKQCVVGQRNNLVVLISSEVQSVSSSQNRKSHDHDGRYDLNVNVERSCALLVCQLLISLSASELEENSSLRVQTITQVNLVLACIIFYELIELFEDTLFSALAVSIKNWVDKLLIQEVKAIVLRVDIARLLIFVNGRNTPVYKLCNLTRVALDQLIVSFDHGGLNTRCLRES